MTTKTEPTMHYAREFLLRLSADKHTRYLIVVEAVGHMPRMIRFDTAKARMWLANDPEHVAGTYRGVEDLTAQDIADAIDAVDDFVPRAYREGKGLAFA